jgi:hypothetical protein
MKEKVLRYNNDWKGRKLYEKRKKQEELNKTFNTKER